MCGNSLNFYANMEKDMRCDNLKSRVRSDETGLLIITKDFNDLGFLQIFKFLLIFTDFEFLIC